MKERSLRDRLSGRHLLSDCSTNFDFRAPEFPGLLQVKPELWRRPKITREPECRIRRYPVRPVENPNHHFDPNVQSRGQHVFRDIDGVNFFA